MTRQVPDLPEAHVRKHLQEVLDTCRETNTAPSVLMLARRLGLSNTTFRRRYPEIAREIADHRAAPPTLRSGPTEHDRLVARNAKLRRRNRDLNSQLALAIAQIQFLTLRAAKLEEDLKAQTNVTRLADRRFRR
ncbi:hypothetical protein ACFWRG_29935 [Micromonospora tulbaghiae]|uniref:Uncharacterized protein n=2 Tax=Streptomyces TaxID=1883 RepID=A0A1E7LTU8_9ACTN|nr:hypothetical protein [Streptomyces nanshensis]OEV19353.1 hypothetical protein AN221_17430 [Streptomyces nanshensis]